MKQKIVVVANSSKKVTVHKIIHPDSNKLSIAGKAGLLIAMMLLLLLEALSRLKLLK
jgi:hypothetical protein